MKLIKFQQVTKLFIDLKFAIFILGVIAFVSSLGSVIEQDQPSSFYEKNYPIAHPIYGFIDFKIISLIGLDHIFSTWWFLSLLLILAISLISCSFIRQLPLYKTSKDFYFKKKLQSFFSLPFFIKIKNVSYLKEVILSKIYFSNFFIYQKKNLFYGYKGLIGRISPILVHISLIIILTSAAVGTFINFKAQEMLPKGEISYLQNPIQTGFFTRIPKIPIRINDFWVEYENNRVHQFYSNLSVLDNYGNELKYQTISVNNPLRYNNLDFYQSDWNLLGIRVSSDERALEKFEYPLFSLKKGTKSWITWIKINESINEKNVEKKFILIFDQLENVFFVYNETGKFLEVDTIGSEVKAFKNLSLIEIIPATGLLIKYDPSILFIYFGFGLLMITALLSYLPYTQIWLYLNYNRNINFLVRNKKITSYYSNCLMGCSTNRGKLNIEIYFENLVRFSEKFLLNFVIKQK